MAVVQNANLLVNPYSTVHKIVNFKVKIAAERDFYVLRSHLDSTRFEPFKAVVEGVLKMAQNGFDRGRPHDMHTDFKMTHLFFSHL